MIPRTEFDQLIDVDATRLDPVSADQVVHGIACVHGYDPGVFSAANWPDAVNELGLEQDALDELDRTCDDRDAYDEAAYEFESVYLDFELGVSGVVAALNAAGCPTFSSCRGHDDGPGVRSTHPWVRLASDAPRLSLLVAAARESGCSLELDDGLVALSAPSAREMVAFGRALVVRQDQFDELVPLVDRAAATPDEDDLDLW